MLVVSAHNAQHVASVPGHLSAGAAIQYGNHVLDVFAVIAGGLNANLPELRSQIGGGNQFIMGSTAATVHCVAGQKSHFAQNAVAHGVRFVLGSGEMGERKAERGDGEQFRNRTQESSEMIREQKLNAYDPS